MKVINVKNKPIVVALDFADQRSVLHLVDQLDPSQCRVKVGKELFTRFGPEIVKTLHQRGFDVFLDLKFHDIPNTVAKAVAAAGDLGVWMVNVHAQGGQAMMQAAKEALLPLANDKPLLIAVTVLTSTSNDELAQMGLPSADVLVPRLAKNTLDAGLDGVVCSAQEAAMVKELCGASFATVTPGIRPANAASDDQKRIVTPEAAIAGGSDYLVIGRPITKAADPLASLEAIQKSLGL